MKTCKSKLWIWIAVPVVLGMLSGWLSSLMAGGFDTFQKPAFTPPDWVFPVVWTILYILMGISGWLVSCKAESQGESPAKTLVPFVVQLALNLAWSFLFFGMQQYFLGFLWALALDAAVLWMILSFYKVSKTAAYLQIPYLLWGIFAVVLSFGVYLMN